MNSYKEVYVGNSAQIEEKKSRFIAHLFKVLTEDEALFIIEQTKKKYWDARHNCYAYIIGNDAGIKRFSDDGEPSQTAGKPMLDVLEGENLRNTLVIVTRYFGGTLLGTGGLVRAYQLATKEGILASEIVTKQEASVVRVKSGYNENGKLKYILANEEIVVMDTQYSDTVSMDVLIPNERKEEILKKMTQAVNARVEFETIKEGYFGLINNELVM